MKNHQKKRLQTNPKQTTIKKKHQKEISEKSKKLKESLKKNLKKV